MEGEKKARIIWGKFFVEKFGNIPGKNFTIPELQKEAEALGVNPNNIIKFIRRECGDILVKDKSGYILRKDWSIKELLDSVNIQRSEIGLEPLELPKPSKVETET